VETTRKLSYEEFLDFEGEDETLRYEWVDGELVVTPAPGYPHQTVVMRLGSELVRLGDRVSHGRTTAQAAFRVSPTRARVPDLVFISSGKLALRPRTKDIAVVPDVVVEVLSPSTAGTDLTEKRKEYRAAGVPAYWLVDLNARSVIVWDFTSEPPKAVEYRSRLPWVLGGKLLGEIDLDWVFLE
jgi:Uma2 family endonuclease